MTIETKLKELELSVIKAKAFERTLQIAIAHGMKIDIPTPIKAEEAEKLIQALREAVSALNNLKRARERDKDGVTRLSIVDVSALADNTVANIEKILGEQK